MFILFEMSVGDFIDRMTIAEIKKNRIGGIHLTSDFELRYEKAYRLFYDDLDNDKKLIVDSVYETLLSINDELWLVEDIVRNPKDDAQLIDMSRQIISLNDARAFNKRKIDQTFGFFGDPKKYVGMNRNYSI